MLKSTAWALAPCKQQCNVSVTLPSLCQTLLSLPYLPLWRSLVLSWSSLEDWTACLLLVHLHANLVSAQSFLLGFSCWQTASSGPPPPSITSLLHSGVSSRLLSMGPILDPSIRLLSLSSLLAPHSFPLCSAI